MSNQNTGKILLVEDNKKLSEINRRTLEQAGYILYLAFTIEEARNQFKNVDPDVILLDVVLPDGSGFDFCQEIRKTTTAHILFLTSRRDHEEKLKGLSLGGDDYITKPYKLDELLMRIAAVMRRRQIDTQPTQIIKKHNLKLDIVAGRAFVDDVDLLLTQKEFALLVLFSQNENENMNASILYEKIWGQPMNNNAGALKNQVSNLRKKLELCNYTISSTRGEGYCFEKR